MNEISINLGDCISEITGREIGIRLDEYVYIDTKEKVEDETILKAEELKAKIEKEMSVPQTISPRQARLILLKYELLDDIESMIATDRTLGIWWEYSIEIKRNEQILIDACNTMGITEEQLDNMFIEASKL